MLPIQLLLLVGLPLAGSTAAQARWSIDSRPVVDLRGMQASGEMLFEHPISATRLTNGTIVVADDNATKIHFFDSAGRKQRSVGRRGDGLGEFRHVSWVGRCGTDSIFVWDMVRRRMSVMTSTGEWVRQYPVPASSSAGPSPYTLACASSGKLVYQPLIVGPALTPDQPVHRGRGPVFGSDANGTAERLLSDIPGGESIRLGGGGGPRPLGRTTCLAALPDRFYVGTADSGYIDAFSSTGERLPGIRIASRSRAATRALFARAVDGIVGSIHGHTEEGAAVRMALLMTPMPESLPPYSCILVDSEDRLWVVLSHPAERETRLRALDAAGGPLADVRLPAGLSVFEIGRDYVLAGGIGTGHDGRVVLFRLRRPATLTESPSRRVTRL